MDTLFDVAIIGGGPSGTAAAIALARRGRRVVLLERSEYDDQRIGEMLPPRTRIPLDRLGVLDAFLSQGHAPSPGIVSAWGDDRLHETHFIFNAYGHGWHIDRRLFDERLAVAAQDAGVCVLRGARFISCDAARSRACSIAFIVAGRRRELEADFVVDATGRTSAVARTQGARRISYDRLVGMVGFFADPSSADWEDCRTLVEAVQSGWWYSARLPGSRVVVAYMTDADLIPPKKTTLRTYYQGLLKDSPHTAARIPCRIDNVRLRVVSANSSRLDRVAGCNWLAIGDAATAYDPLSSQGIYRALGSGIHAAEVIATSRSDSRDVRHQYELRLQKAFNAYLRNRTAYYARETRWPDSAFWTRRQKAIGIR